MGFHWAATAALPFMAVSAFALDCGHAADRCGANGVVREPIDCARPVSEVLHAAPASGLFTSQPVDFRPIELARLETEIAHSQRTPGVRQRPRSGRQVTRYTKLIIGDRKNDDAYFRRAIANLYSGALTKAVSDMTHASDLDPTYAYYAIWLDILSKRNHQASRLPQAVSQIDMTKWPAPIVRMFLGEVTPAAVLTAADDPDARTRKGRLCEANFYIGELALQQGTNEEAARRFRLATDDCPHFNFVESGAADAELRGLGASP